VDTRTQWERFRDASVVLAGGGPVKPRLLQAFQGHLSDLSPDELPRELRGSYSAVAAALRSGQRTGTLDAVSVSVLKMSEAEACRHAQDIVRIFGGLTETQPVTRPATVLRAVPDGDAVPAFLNRA
jgi:hypothetical protein